MSAFSVLIYVLFLQIFAKAGDEFQKQFHPWYQMHAWSPWSGCSSACGPGVYVRYRGCRIGFKEVPVCPYYGHEESPCNGYHCPPRPGSWSSWSSSPCSKSCGGGMKTKYRTCICPIPFLGGQGCYGKSMETVSCNTHLCPVNGAWSSWQNPSRCTVSCGGGVSIRTRKCNNPSPSHGGKTCRGVSVHTESCNTQSCPASTTITLAQRKTPKHVTISATTYPKTSITSTTTNPTTRNHTANTTVKTPTPNLTTTTTTKAITTPQRHLYVTIRAFN